jgi:hypothetical protein
MDEEKATIGFMKSLEFFDLFYLPSLARYSLRVG